MKPSSTNRAAVKRSSGGRHGREIGRSVKVEEKPPMPEVYVRVKAKDWGTRMARAQLTKQGRYVYLAWRGENGPTRLYLGSVKDSSSTKRIRLASSTSPAPAGGRPRTSSKCRRKKRSKNARQVTRRLSDAGGPHTKRRQRWRAPCRLRGGVPRFLLATPRRQMRSLPAKRGGRGEGPRRRRGCSIYLSRPDN